MCVTLIDSLHLICHYCSVIIKIVAFCIDGCVITIKKRLLHKSQWQNKTR